MKLMLRLLISLLVFLPSQYSLAETSSNVKNHHFFAGARTGFDLIKPVNQTLGGGLSLGLEGGLNFNKLGNISISVMTCGYDSNTQIFHYLFGYSHEIIWNFVVSGFLGIQRYMTESGAPLGSHPSVSGFAYGFGLSYLFPDLYQLDESASIQLIPEALYFKGSDLRWYGAVINFRFNFLN